MSSSVAILVPVSSERRESFRNPVKSWTDPESWAERLTPEGCPFCRSEPWSVHIELPASWVLIPEEAVLPGYVLVVSNRHVIEPYELPPDESAQFWADAMPAVVAQRSQVWSVRSISGAHQRPRCRPRVRTSSAPSASPVSA